MTNSIVLDLGHNMVAASQDQDLCPSSVHFLNHPQGITKQHFIPTEYEKQVISTYKPAVFILTRNLPDAIISMQDHLDEAAEAYPDDPLIRMPTVHCPRSAWAVFGASQKQDWLITHWAPWTMAFVAAWQALENSGVPLMWLDYDAMMAHKNDTLQNVLEFAGRKRERDGDLDSKRWRFNKGVKGRGRAISRDGYHRLLDMANSYDPFHEEIHRRLLSET